VTAHIDHPAKTAAAAADDRARGQVDLAERVEAELAKASRCVRCVRALTTLRRDQTRRHHSERGQPNRPRMTKEDHMIRTRAPIVNTMPAVEAAQLVGWLRD
jgi:hypothetical protein